MRTPILVILSISALMVSCNKSADINEEENETKDPVTILLTPAQTQVVTSGNINSIKLFSDIATEELAAGKSANTIISPLSLYIALGMLWNGADGSTKEEIQKFLSLEGVSEDEVNLFFKKMIESLPVTDPKVKLSIANSIWHNKSLLVYDNFKKKNSDFFYSSIESLDFASPLSVGIINKWCSGKTNGIIDKIIDQINPEEVMFLINALYFKAPWKTPFKPSETVSAPFYTTAGPAVSAQMMSLSGTFRFFESTGFKALTLPYGNGAFSMVLILPQAGKRVTEVASELKEPATWVSVLGNITESKVYVKIPKFKFEYKVELDSYLKKLGVTKSFNPAEANFTKIANVGAQKLYITRVLQKAAIEVNEEGSEAAAVTAIGVGVTSAPVMKEFIADRPFIFAIIENSTGTVLFIGKVENPALGK
jgi:serpin B